MSTALRGLSSTVIVPCLRYSNDESTNPLGGGLKKLQGLKEEIYFQSQNYQLMKKIRDQDSKLKCGNCQELEKLLFEESVDRDEKTEETASNEVHNKILYF